MLDRSVQNEVMDLNDDSSQRLNTVTFDDMKQDQELDSNKNKTQK